MKKVTIICSLLLCASLLIALSPIKDDKVKPKIHRVVCFKFKAGTSAEAKAKHMTEFAAFVKMLPQVISYRAGKTVKGESKTEPGYDVMHYLTFEREQDILVYDVHPAHQKFVEANKGIWDSVLAVNGAIEK